MKECFYFSANHFIEPLNIIFYKSDGLKVLKSAPKKLTIVTVIFRDKSIGDELM